MTMPNLSTPGSRYFGKVCGKHPHLNGERRKANRSCPACLNEKRVIAARLKPEDRDKKAVRTSAYQKRTRNQQTEKMRRWRAANPEKAAANWAVYAAKNADRRAQRRRAFQNDFPERVRAYQATRRAVKRRAIPAWADQGRIAEIYREARVRELASGEVWHVDHIVPLNHPLVCGLHVEHNLQIIPKKLNLIKGNRHWPDMLESTQEQRLWR